METNDRVEPGKRSGHSVAEIEPSYGGVESIVRVPMGMWSQGESTKNWLSVRVWWSTIVNATNNQNDSLILPRLAQGMSMSDRHLETGVSFQENGRTTKGNAKGLSQ